MVIFIQSWKIRMVLLQIALYPNRFSSLVDRLSSSYLLLCNKKTKIQQLKIIHIILISVGEEFRHCLLGFSFSVSLTGCNKVSAGPQFTQGSTGKEFASKITWWLAEFSFSWNVGQGFGLHWLLATSPSCQVGSSMCFIKACKPRRCQKGSTSKIDDTVFYNLIKELTFCHFCYIYQF